MFKDHPRDLKKSGWSSLTGGHHSEGDVKAGMTVFLARFAESLIVCLFSWKSEQLVKVHRALQICQTARPRDLLLDERQQIRRKLRERFEKRLRRLHLLRGQLLRV